VTVKDSITTKPMGYATVELLTPTDSTLILSALCTNRRVNSALRLRLAQQPAINDVHNRQFSYIFTSMFIYSIPKWDAMAGAGLQIFAGKYDPGD